MLTRTIFGKIISNAETGFPERSWSLHLWIYSKPDWQPALADVGWTR